MLLHCREMGRHNNNIFICAKRENAFIKTERNDARNATYIDVKPRRPQAYVNKRLCRSIPLYLETSHIRKHCLRTMHIRIAQFYADSCQQ